jgi:hypothetical protein
VKSTFKGTDPEDGLKARLTVGVEPLRVGTLAARIVLLLVLEPGAALK